MPLSARPSPYPSSVAVGSDHRGYALKRSLLAHLRRDCRGSLLELGARNSHPIDYPDLAKEVHAAFQSGLASRAILICGSGVGMTIAANKLPGLRACVCHDPYSAHQGVEHDDMNVLVLGADVISDKLARELVSVFLPAQFDRLPRHLRRLRKIEKLEKRILSNSER